MSRILNSSLCSGRRFCALIRGCARAGVLALILHTGGSAHAAITWSISSTVASGSSYTVVFSDPLTGPMPPNTTVRLYKNGALVAQGNVSVGYTTTDYGAQTITYRAESYTGEVSSRTVAIVTANNPPIGSFDFASETLRWGETFRVSGWAADPDIGAPVTRVDVLIDGVDRGDAVLGGDRTDVAAAHGRNDYRYAGFDLVLSTAGWSPGIHTVSIKAWDDRGAATDLGARNFTVAGARPVTALTVNRALLHSGTRVTLSSLSNDASGDLTSQAIEYRAPGQPAWISGTPNWASVGSSWWSGTVTSRHLLECSHDPAAVGVWEFRARGKDATAAFGDYVGLKLTVLGADRDRDGMPDDWELRHGLNPDNAADAAADPDGDGLNSLAEYLRGGDPFSGADGLSPGPLNLTLKTPPGSFIVELPAWKFRP